LVVGSWSFWLVVGSWSFSSVKRYAFCNAAHHAIISSTRFAPSK
jgi:hypothetical protein